MLAIRCTNLEASSQSFPALFHKNNDTLPYTFLPVCQRPAPARLPVPIRQLFPYRTSLVQLATPPRLILPLLHSTPIFCILVAIFPTFLTAVQQDIPWKRFAGT